MMVMIKVIFLKLYHNIYSISTACLTCHLLHPVKSLPINDRLMDILNQVHLQLPTVLFFPSR